MTLSKGSFAQDPVAATARWDAVDLALTGAFFTADRAYRVTGITARVDVAGTDVGGVTLVVRKAPSGTAISGGTVLHTGSVNLKGTANTNQAITLSATATDLLLAAGDSLGTHLTGTPAVAQGAVTVFMVAQ